MKYFSLWVAVEDHYRSRNSRVYTITDNTTTTTITGFIIIIIKDFIS